MALTVTSLAADMSADALVLRATSVTGASVGGVAKVDNEYMVITAIDSPNVYVRSRGDNGGVAVAHDILAPVVFGLGSDIPAFGAGQDVPLPTVDFDVSSVGENGVIPVPTRNAVIHLTKGAALASTTLGAPSKAQDGLELKIIAATAFAHVITATALIEDGVTGGAKTTLTFAAFVGASITLSALNGKWAVLNKNVVTIT